MGEGTGTRLGASPLLQGLGEKKKPRKKKSLWDRAPSEAGPSPERASVDFCRFPFSLGVDRLGSDGTPS